MYISPQSEEKERNILRFMKVHGMGSWCMSKVYDVIVLKWKKMKWII